MRASSRRARFCAGRKPHDDTPVMIVDASVHVWSGETARYPWSPIDGVDIPPDDRSAERLLADLDAAGIDAAVAVQPRAYGYDHAYLVDVLRRHGARIAGIGLVDPDDSSAAAVVTKLIGQGISGVRLFALTDTRNGLAASFTAAALDRAAQSDVPVSLLVDPPRLVLVGALAARHPGTTLIVDHLGLCTATTPAAAIAGLLALADFPNVYLRLSAMTGLSNDGYPFADLAPLIRDAYRAFGGRRLIWGTDYPHALASGPYRQSLDAVRLAMDFIAASDLPAILGGTAARLFHLDNPASGRHRS